MVSDLNKLGIALKSLDTMQLGTVGVNLANVEAYRTALKGLSVEQSVFALASKGATEEQIRQILVTDQAKLKDVEAAMAKAGLTTATKALNAEEMIELATKKGISIERAKEIANALGLIATEEGQVVSKKQLTVATLQQVGATDAEITAILGLNAAETANIGITNVLTASFAKLWAVITAHPIGAILTAIGVVAVGAVAAYNKWGDTLENTKEKLSDLKSECQEIVSDLQAVNSELETTQQRLEELEGKDTLTFTEKEEYDNLVKINNELQRKIDLLELEEKNKRKEQNKTFVSAMEKDTENPFEHEVNPDGKKPAGQYSISDEYLTSETGYINAQFEIREQLLDDLANAETEKEKERIQKRIDEINSYLEDKNTEWKTVSDGIDYIENPTTEDDKAVNEWLDYIADFQDRMAIAMSKDDASSNAQYKTNTFNRVVDNWQFDETVQGLQDLGKEGKVTAEMLDDPKYDEFINKLVFLGVIDSADNLEDVALAFNSVATSAENAADSASQYGNKITVPSWSTKFQDLWDSEGFSETKKSMQELAKETGITEDDIVSLGKENEDLADLLEKSGISAQFAATCFEKMCNGTGDFSSITDSMLALDKALHETETALENVTSAKTKYDEAMSEDDYNTEFKNYQEAYASAMESFKNGEYGKKFRASMEYLLGEDSYSMSIEELYKSMKKLKSVFGEDANNGLEFLDKLYEKKDVLKELDSTLEKTADGGYKFDIKVEDFDNIGKSLGMTTEEVTACVEALGMFGDYADFDIDKVKDALDGMAISVDKTGSSTVSLQTLENALADLGYEGYEAYQILEQLRSQDDVKLLNFDVSNSEQVHSLINKLKELDAIHIDPSGAIDTSSLVQKMADFGMTSDQISTFIKQINELTTYHFDGNNFEDLKSIQTYVDGVLGNTDQSSTESMETLKDAEDGAKTSAENLQDAIEGVNTTSVSSVTDGVSDLSDELNTANNKAITLKANLDKLNTNNLNTSNSNTSSSSSGGKLTKKDKTKPEATGTLAYAKGSKVTLDKDEEALVNELGEESVVRNGELHIIPGGAHIEKLKKGDIIFNHKQTEELKKNGRVTTNNGRGKVIGAFPSGTVSGKNPATKKNWSSSKDDKDKDKKNKSSSTDTTKFSQAIDWCAQSINKITSVIDKINAKLSSTNASLASQIKNYKQLINKQQSLINGYKKSESVYKKQYSKALSKLSKSDQKKVKDGTYTIEQFSGTTKKSGKKSKAEKRYNNIQKALEARDNYLDAQTDSVNAKNQLQEYAEELASVRWDKAAEQVEKLNNEISVLDTKMSNVSGYKAKNKVLSEQLKLQKKILTKQENAYENTQSDANAYYKKISSKYKKNKNSDGTIKTSGVTNQTQLKYIKIYNAYVKELAKDEIELAQAQEDYTAAVQEAAVARAENIKADYDNKLSLIEAKTNELNSEIALAEARGQVASAEYYKLLGDNSNQRLSELENEKKLLEKQLSSTRAYTDEWYEIKQAVIEVDEAIADETLNAVENINKQIEAMEKLKEAKNNYLSSTIGTYDWLESLTDTDDYYNEDGSFSDKGKAVAKGKINKIKLYEQQAKNAQENIDSLDAMYANNKDDPTYLNKRIELVEEWQNATKSMYDEQQSLHDMYINGLKEESEALQELIDKKMESLKADKAEYDYQKSIAEKTKNITDLEKQLAMLEGDNSEEARAKRQKVKVELEEAQQDLEDTQYDKYLERLENSLGDLQDRFDAVIDKLDKQGAIPSMEELQKLTDDNASDVTKGVDKIIKEAGLDKLLGEEGIGSLNKTTAELLSTPSTGISDKITATNKLLNKIYTALSDGSSGTTEEDIVSIAEALGTYDSKNKTADTSGKSALNKYIMSQGYSAMDEEQMVTLKDAILNSKYSEGMDEGLRETLTNIASADNLKKSKDANSSNNKNAILKAYKYTQIQEYIDKNAIQPTGKNIDNYKTNKYIYEKTGKVLDADGLHGLGKLLGVEKSDGTLDLSVLYKALIQSGYSDGGIVKKAISVNGDDGLATLKVGEAVLTPVQTTAFTELAENIVPFNNLIGDIVERPNIPTVDRGVGATNTIESINVELNLPNVTDKESFMKMVKSESDVQRMLQNIGFGGVMGSNKKFNVYKL